MTASGRRSSTDTLRSAAMCWRTESHHKRAEMLVRMICREDGSKQFEVVSENGWGGARKHVFPRLLEAEIEAARPDRRERSRITPENYTFEMIGTECVRGRSAYVMAIEPKIREQISHPRQNLGGCRGIRHPPD